MIHRRPALSAQASFYRYCEQEQLIDLSDPLAGGGAGRSPALNVRRPKDFDDYWSPFLGGQGPAGAYVMSRPEEERDDLREAVRASLPAAVDDPSHCPLGRGPYAGE